MADEKKESIGGLSLLLGGIVLIAFVVFLVTGGELGGKKTIDSDDDLPPIATTDR